jgi:hypothetical protein
LDTYDFYILGVGLGFFLKFIEGEIIVRDVGRNNRHPQRKPI